MSFAKGHNAVMPVRLEPMAPQSRVKHSTTEPLHSQNITWIRVSPIPIVSKQIVPD